MKYIHVFIITLLLFIIYADPTLGAPPSPPPEPDEMTNADNFVAWDLEPNSLLSLHYAFLTSDNYDPVLITKRRVKSWGSIRDKADLNRLSAQWQGYGYHFIYFYNPEVDTYTWYAVMQYPLFYEYDGILFIDREEDGVNGNEEIYEIFGEQKKL